MLVFLLGARSWALGSDCRCCHRRRVRSLGDRSVGYDAGRRRDALYLPGPGVTGGAAAKAVPEVIDLGGDRATLLCREVWHRAPPAAHDQLQPHAVPRHHLVRHDRARPLHGGGDPDAGRLFRRRHGGARGVPVARPVARRGGESERQALAADPHGLREQLLHPGPAATLDLARCRTPSGAACEDPVLRPDNAPICPVIDSTGRLTFVTLRGGGLLVVDSTATPMAILAEYDRATVHPNGCGGAEAAGRCTSAPAAAVRQTRCIRTSMPSRCAGI